MSKDPQVNSEGVLEQLLRIVRRRKWVVLQALIVVPLLALLFSLTQEKEYTATATLLFRQAPIGIAEGESVEDPTRVAATNGQLVGLPVVAEKAAEELDGVPAGEILGSVSVEASAEADTAKISATTGDPELSAAMANAYGRAYISFRREADRGQVQDAIDVAETSLQGLSPAEQEGKEGTALTEQLDRLKLAQALQTGGAELVQPASPPAEASSPKPLEKRDAGDRARCPARPRPRRPARPLRPARAHGRRTGAALRRADPGPDPPQLAAFAPSPSRASARRPRRARRSGFCAATCATSTLTNGCVRS